MTTSTLAELEKAEYLALAELSKLRQGDLRRVRLRELLAKAREAKTAFLAANPGVLRKAGALGLGLPVPGDAVAKTIRETSDRISEERRLAKGKRRTYLAPEAYRGEKLKLVDGRVLNVPADGQCEIEIPDDGEMAAAVHHQLKHMHFIHEPEDETECIKAALRRPIVGDRAFVRFLNRNAAA
jgi:hypothetical protein